MGLDLVHVLSPKRHYCEFICGRCKRLTSLDSYVASNCAHPICKSCCNKKMPKSCPRCTKPVGELKCLKASQPLAHRVLTRIKVACPMRHRSGSHQGCKWVGSYDEIQAHLDSTNKHHPHRSQPRRQSSSKKNKHELEDSVVITTAASAEAAVVVEDTPPTPITADSSSPVIVMKKESSKELITTLKKEGSRETVKTIPRSNCTSAKMESCCNNGSSDTMDVVVETTEVEDNNNNNILATTAEKTNNEILVVTVDSLESIDTDEMDLHKAYNNREVSNHKKKEVEVEPAPPIIEIPTPIIQNKKTTVDTTTTTTTPFESHIIQDDDNGGEPDTVEELKEQQQQGQQQYPTTCSYEDSCADFGKAFEECIVPMEIVVANDNPDSWAIKDAAIIPPEEPPPPTATSKSPLRRRSSSSNRRRQRRRASSSSILSQEQQQLSESDNDVEMSEHHRGDNNNRRERERPPITRKKDLQRSVMETSDSEDKNDGGGSSSSRSLQSRSRRNSYQEHSESETSHENDDHREQQQQQQQQHQTPRSSSKRKRRRSKRVIEISEPVEDTDDMVVADNNNNMFMSSNNNNNNDITNDLDVASTWKEEGIRAFNAGNYKEAGEFLTCAINSLPNSNREPKLVSMLLSNRAESFLKMDLFTRCLEDAEEALDLDNQNVKAYLVKSTAQTELSCFSEACKTLARGCLNTDSQEISEQLKSTRELSRCIREIRSLENENRHSDILRVIQTSDSSLGRRPHKLISQARAAALVDLGQYDEAITETNELLEKNDKKGNNNNAVAFFIRARAKFFNGLVSESLSDCQSAMTTNDYNTDNMRELDDFGDLVNCVEHSFRFAEEAMKNKDYEQGCNFYGLAFDSIQSKLELPKNSELYRILHMGSAEANYKAGNTEQALMHSNLVVESSQHNNNGNGNGENNNNDNNKYSSSSSMEDQKPSSIVVQPSYSQELVCSTGNHPSKY